MTNLTVLPDGWMDRDEVRKTLGKSQSTIERLVASGDIKTKLKPVPHRKPMRLYASEDVTRLTEAWAHRENRAVLRKAHEPRPSLALPAASNEGEKPEVDKLWLSLEAAAAVSGLAESYLMGAIETGKIVGVKGGPHGAWRIRKCSLEEFAG